MKISTQISTIINEFMTINNVPVKRLADVMGVTELHIRNSVFETLIEDMPLKDVQRILNTLEIQLDLMRKT